MSTNFTPSIAVRMLLVQVLLAVLAVGCNDSEPYSLEVLTQYDSLEKGGVHLSFSIVHITTQSESSGWRIRYILLSENGDYNTYSEHLDIPFGRERITFHRSGEREITMEQDVNICWIDKEGRLVQQAQTSLTPSDLPKSFEAIRASDELTKELLEIRSITELEQLLRRAIRNRAGGTAGLPSSVE